MTVRYIPTQAKTLKMFALYSPVNFDEFAPLMIYYETSLSDEQFAMDVLMALKEPKTGKRNFISRLIKQWQIIPTMCDGDYLIKQAMNFLNHLEQELLLFNLYQNGLLPFNCLWIEGTDSLVFFRVDENDV
jgi:hypothetical protein